MEQPTPQEVLRRLERQCRACIAQVHATSQQRINDAVAETEAAKKECRRLYKAHEITKAEYKAFKEESRRVVEQLRARIQELEREKAALEREKAALERERTAWRAGGGITIIKPNGVQINGPPNKHSLSLKDEDGTTEVTFF